MDWTNYWPPESTGPGQQFLATVRNAEDYGEAQAWALLTLAETLGAGLFAIADALEGIRDQLGGGPSS
jgi:hypothetical protein